MPGPGKIGAKDFEIPPHKVGGQIIVRSQVSLYNFEINVSKLKEEHKRFLSEAVIPALKTNQGARVALTGSASRSGERNHNNELSRDRAKAVNGHLSAGGAGGQIVEAIGVGQPAQGPMEDEGDRAAFLFIEGVN